MVKFNEKSPSHFPLAYFYSAMDSFVKRIGNVETSLPRLIQMRQEVNALWQAFDDAYTRSLKSMSTKTVSDLDKLRDNYVWVIEHVADLWAEKLDEDELNIHGRRVKQAFKDFDFRATEALVAENAKIQNIEQVFASPELQADLAAMGLTELNSRLVAITQQIIQVMSERNEEQSTIVVGELKTARDALTQKYAAFLIYLNAVQELQPEEQISMAAQYYNQDLQKVEMQLAQSRKGGGVSDKPQSDGGSQSGQSGQNTQTGDNTGNNGQQTGDNTDDNGQQTGDNTGNDNPGGDNNDNPGGDINDGGLDD